MASSSELTYSWDSIHAERFGEKLFRAAEEALEEVRFKMSEEERATRTGGILKVRVADDQVDMMRGWRRVRMPVRPSVGFVADQAKLDAYVNHATDKMIRLMKSVHLAGPESWNTWEHRNPSRGEYQGGIRFEDVVDPRLGRGFIQVILAFSGLTEWADEAVCYLIAEKMGWATRAENITKAKQTGMGNRSGGNMFFLECFPLAA